MDSVLLAPIAPEVEAELIAKVSKDLRYLWKNVTLQVQARLSQLGFFDAETWAKAEDCEKEMRLFIKKDVGLRREGNENYRGLVARLLASWESAVMRGQKRKAEEAEQRAGNKPKRLEKKTHIAIVKAYNLATGRVLPESEIPASVCVWTRRSRGSRTTRSRLSFFLQLPGRTR